MKDLGQDIVEELIDDLYETQALINVVKRQLGMISEAEIKRLETNHPEIYLVLSTHGFICSISK